MIEDFRLKVFAEVARLGSFTAAARALGVSQPAVSQNIAELERFAGTRLLYRSRGGVELTARGRQMLAQAEVVLRECANLENSFRAPRTILLRNVSHEGRVCSILISDGRFADLDAPSDTPADKTVEAEGMAILPALYNTHNHAAMTLLRGYADDMPLEQWLQDYVWPFEDKLGPEDIRRGSDIAVKEMISSGSVFFSDMYFDIEETIKAVDESGMRAAIGITVMENHSKSVEEQKMQFVRDWKDPSGGRIQLVMAPHSVYTVGTDKLRRSAAFARRNGLRLHIHLAETRTEVENCIRDHGTTPVRYLDSLGFLGPDVIAAHCVHVDSEEWKILAERGVTVSHCPCSNMKLGSGRFPYELALESGCRLTLGTDGASSNNNLDLREEMKFAALLAKVNGDPALLPAAEIFRWATVNGAEAFGIDAGEIARGKLADAVLVDLGQPDFELRLFGRFVRRALCALRRADHLQLALALIFRVAPVCGGHCTAIGIMSGRHVRQRTHSPDARLRHVKHRRRIIGGRHVRQREAFPKSSASRAVYACRSINPIKNTRLLKKCAEI